MWVRRSPGTQPSHVIRADGATGFPSVVGNFTWRLGAEYFEPPSLAPPLHDDLQLMRQMLKQPLQ
jgi:hypothetical protein